MNELIRLLEEKNERLLERERELADQSEELQAQKEELTAAIEELIAKNQSLNNTLVQLRERNYELDQILYRTSHDLRSPLTSIKGILNLFEADKNSQGTAEYFQHLFRNVDQMDNLLHSLSSLSKVTLEEPEFSKVNLNEIIQRVIKELTPDSSDETSIQFHANLEVQEIDSDKFLTATIIRELLSNALTFRDPNRTGSITLTVKSCAEKYNIEIIDDGEGIPQDIRPHIFEMFYRGSERSTGSGLGLYLVKNAVGRLKGTIELDAAPHPTRFILTLPTRRSLALDPS